RMRRRPPGARFQRARAEPLEPFAGVAGAALDACRFRTRVFAPFTVAPLADPRERPHSVRSGERPHSARSASTGFARTARRTGTKLAAAPTVASRRAIPSDVAGSNALMP